ncbi:hypothetical protein [Propionivibrio sp.]|uniref:hypothetical protein n=1 Tax=Propionivibrio sp. TaxID=2212460 RepID=UPI0025DA14CC|nr:hypothetical protein [Propionivibrio sp.]MBK7356250.1 hypothetical protein [Propionivibrio sp.]MBK8746209.1 hypothetical protein [Propionivibrio sp.]MBK8894480.1 hypothetical protein [Propionivibrio sp.]MBL0208367.1 hypothetical protein [Propionivibrio sp.]
MQNDDSDHESCKKVQIFLFFFGKIENQDLDELAVNTSDAGGIGASGTSPSAGTASTAEKSEGSAPGKADFTRLGRHRSVG